MKKLKTTVTIEFEDTLDMQEYLSENPDGTEEEAMEDLEKFTLLDLIGHVEWAAENRLPANMQLSYKFMWEDK